MKIHVYGRLVEICGHNNIELDSGTTVHELRKNLEKKFPDLKNQKYLVAKDRRIVSEDTSLEKSSEIALMPPYSGG